jgi:hypothetical protein
MDGNLYGDGVDGAVLGNYNGTALQITPSGAFTTLYRFAPCKAAGPGLTRSGSGLTLRNDGNFYGVTPLNGGISTPYGLVGGYFQITPTGALTPIWHC